MALSKQENAQLKKIQQDPAWDVVVKMLEQRINELGKRAAESNAPDAFQELRAVHRAQGGVAELKQFFDDLERGAFDD